MRRKFILGVVALALPISTAATFGAASATASSNGLGTGTYSCKALTGTISFSPPLSNTAKIETTTVTATASKCTGTAKPAVLTAISKSKTTGTKPSSCGSLAAGTKTAVKFTTTYTPAGTSSSTYTGNAVGGVNSAKQITFAVTGTVAGSYKSALNGAKANAVIKETTTAVLTACGTTGVTTLHILSGTTTNN